MLLTPLPPQPSSKPGPGVARPLAGVQGAAPPGLPSLTEHGRAMVQRSCLAFGATKGGGETGPLLALLPSRIAGLVSRLLILLGGVNQQAAEKPGARSDRRAHSRIDSNGTNDGATGRADPGSRRHAVRVSDMPAQPTSRKVAPSARADFLMASSVVPRHPPPGTGIGLGQEGRVRIASTGRDAARSAWPLAQDRNAATDWLRVIASGGQNSRMRGSALCVSASRLLTPWP